MSNVRLNISKEIVFDALRISPGVLLQIQEFWLKRIQGFTRRGTSLVTDSSFKSLSTAYKAFRANYTGTKGKSFRPNKSNLTLTGQLLESLKGRSNVRKQEVTIFASGRRDDGQNNADVAEYVAEQGRPFLGIDKKGIQRIEQIITRDLRRQWKKRRRR